MRRSVRQVSRTARRLFSWGPVALAIALVIPAAAHAQRARSFAGPTHSSPIAKSVDDRYVWVVNPGPGTVSVISTRTNRVVETVDVGDEPVSVALDPRNRYAYVANAADGTVSVLRITKASARDLNARVDRRVARRGTFATGSEPWNIVASPDGRRIFVSNSGQDTITVIDATDRKRIIGHVDLHSSRCNSPDRNRQFQPRGLAVTQSSRQLYVTGFLAFTRPGGRQGSDTGKEGVVCRLNINTRSDRIRSYRPAARIAVAPQDTGFAVDSNGDATPDPTSAFPNQLQSVVIRGRQAYLPNIAASPDGPLRFNVDTQAFVSVLDGIGGNRQSDAGSAKFLNLNLGARNPEGGKKRLFFASPWAIAFTNQRRSGKGYAVSQGADVLVKVNVAGNGKLSNTVDQDTTRYVDLNDPANPATSGANAGKNPQGIVINRAGTRAYTANVISRNVSVVDLRNDRVERVIRTAPLPAPGSAQERTLVGAEMFFSSRGVFNRPAGTTVSTLDRLASEGWQSCSSCHFEGLTDGVAWEFETGVRKSIPLNATFNPRDRTDQRILNYSAVRDEVEDFELNSRNVSGPGPLAAPRACSAPLAGQPATSTFDPDHGLLIGDNADINSAPCVINNFNKPNAERPQHTVTLPGSSTAVPAWTAMREWVRLAVRTPNAPLSRSRARPGLRADEVRQGRALFERAGCTACHVGPNFTISSNKGFPPPPPAAELPTEATPPATLVVDGRPSRPVGAQQFNRFLRDVGSFNRGVPGKGNEFPGGPNVGGDEVASAPLTGNPPVAGAVPDGLGIDYNADGKGIGFNPPSLLGVNLAPPYYHNGACETLACVVGDVKHRTANGTRPDLLGDARQRALVTTFLRSIDARTAAPGQ